MRREPFSVESQTLLSGRNLIEASAGTGKTFSIALIVLRLILEKEIKLPNILAVTFTNAAAEELKSRIRKFLKSARESLTASFNDKDPVHRIVRNASENRGKDEITARLEAALAQLDEACVDTIHGFCLRTLRELAFETGMPFDAKLEADESDLILRAARDFFRQNFTQTTPEIAAFIAENSFTPELSMSSSE